MLRSILAVTTPADVTALTTLERVKAELGITDSASDDLLAIKIDEATSDIEVRCRPFRRETVTETFWPASASHRTDRSWWACIESLPLSRRPVASVASVTVDDVIVAASEYRTDAASGQLFRLDSMGYPSRWTLGKSAIVVYDGGYHLPGEQNRDLPPALESAAVELVGSYWASRGRDRTLKAEENPGVARFEYWVGAVGDAGDLPPGVMAKIAPFRKLTVA